jgi:hypothetical protein
MFSAPKKTIDGRYYVKANEKKLVQLNGVTLASALEKTLQATFTLDAASWAKVSEMDAVIVSAAKENCESWFQRQVADKTLEAAYVKPTETINVSMIPGAKVYCNREEVVDPVVEGSVCDIVLEFSGVWFAKKTFGPTWKLVQTRVRPPPKKKAYESYLFQDDDALVSSDED